MKSLPTREYHAPRHLPWDLESLEVSGLVDALEEERFWRRYFRSEPYYDPLVSCDQYAAAYRLGIYHRLAQGRISTWTDSEAALHLWWECHGGAVGMGWQQAQAPVRAAWMRVHNALTWRQ